MRLPLFLKVAYAHDGLEAFPGSTNERDIEAAAQLHEAVDVPRIRGTVFGGGDLAGFVPSNTVTINQYTNASSNILREDVL